MKFKNNMNKFFTILSIFLFCLVLTCCNSNNLSLTDSSEPTITSNEKSVDVTSIEILEPENSNIVQSISLLEEGYIFSTPNDFTGAISPYYKSQSLTESSIKYLEVDNLASFALKDYSFNGITGVIHVPIYEENPQLLDIGSLPLICTMAITLDSVVQKSVLKIGNTEYTIKDLESYILFNDENISIFDITDIVLKDSNYDDFVSELYDEDLVDIIWAKSIRVDILQNYAEFFHYGYH